jgi:hypothetical protein
MQPLPSSSFVRISSAHKGKEGQSTRRIRTKEEEKEELPAAVRLSRKGG